MRVATYRATTVVEGESWKVALLDIYLQSESCIEKHCFFDTTICARPLNLIRKIVLGMISMLCFKIKLLSFPFPKVLRPIENKMLKFTCSFTCSCNTRMHCLAA